MNTQPTHPEHTPAKWRKVPTYVAAQTHVAHACAACWLPVGAHRKQAHQLDGIYMIYMISIHRPTGSVGDKDQTQLAHSVTGGADVASTVTKVAVDVL